MNIWTVTEWGLRSSSNCLNSRIVTSNYKKRFPTKCFILRQKVTFCFALSFIFWNLKDRRCVVCEPTKLSSFFTSYYWCELEASGSVYEMLRSVYFAWNLPIMWNCRCPFFSSYPPDSFAANIIILIITTLDRVHHWETRGNNCLSLEGLLGKCSDVNAVSLCQCDDDLLCVSVFFYSFFCPLWTKSKPVHGEGVGR